MRLFAFLTVGKHKPCEIGVRTKSDLVRSSIARNPDL
jgi:hypothetical protein